MLHGLLLLTHDACLSVHSAASSIYLLITIVVGREWSYYFHQYDIFIFISPVGNINLQEEKNSKTEETK